MNAVLGEFLGEQIEINDDFKPNELLKAVSGDQEDDWDGLKDDFRVFLEKQLDRYHGGGLENPEIEESSFEEETHYSLGYIPVEMADDASKPDNVFMTSAIEFENPENNDYAVQVEYLQEDEGLEAIEHLLETNQQDKVSEMINYGLRINSDRALKAYQAVVENDILLAKELKEKQNDEELEASMRATLLENSQDELRDFRDELDF